MLSLWFLTPLGLRPISPKKTAFFKGEPFGRNIATSKGCFFSIAGGCAYGKTAGTDASPTNSESVDGCCVPRLCGKSRGRAPALPTCTARLPASPSGFGLRPQPPVIEKICTPRQ